MTGSDLEKVGFFRKSEDRMMKDLGQWPAPQKAAPVQLCAVCEQAHAREMTAS